MIPDTTPRQRRVALWAGVLLIGAAVYLDILTGFNIPLQTRHLALIPGIWTIMVQTQVPGLPDGLQEARRFALDAVAWTGIWTVLLVAVVWFYPGYYGSTYLLYATAGGQILTSLAFALFWPVILLIMSFVIGWVLEFIRVHRSTPEQRVQEGEA